MPDVEAERDSGSSDQSDESASEGDGGEDEEGSKSPKKDLHNVRPRDESPNSKKVSFSWLKA